METLDQIIARWDSGEGKPYKGSLIDWKAYDGDGIEPPSDIGCMCAQGQVLHLLGGWEPKRLFATEQPEADREVAKLLNISLAHAILLRKINDSVDGAPSIVLTNPEQILGDNAHIVLAFWRYMDRMTREQWNSIGNAFQRTIQNVAWEWEWEWENDTTSVADAAARSITCNMVASHLISVVVFCASKACSEIQIASILREQGTPFFILPLFGFANPEAVLTADERTTNEI